MSKPTIIITGASQGLGAAMAAFAADHGAQVVLTARSQPRLELQARAIAERGGSALPVAGDVSRFEDCQRIVERTLEAFGTIDALINNAGTIEPLAPVSEARREDWAHHMAVNVLGPLMMCQLAMPHLRQSRGRVVNVTSHGAELVIPGASAYSASKAALNRFSVTLAAEEPAITVLLFIPGEVDTAMQAVIRDKGKGNTPDEIHRFFVDQYEQGKLLPPDTPARAAVSLAMKAPPEWTGETIEWDDERAQELARLL